MAGDAPDTGDSNVDTKVDAKEHATNGSLGSDLLLQQSRRKKGHKVEDANAEHPPQRFTSHAAYQQNANLYWQKINAAKQKHALVAQFPPLYIAPPETSPPQPVPDTDPLNSKGKLPSLNDLRDSSKLLSRFADGDKKLPDFSLSTVDEAEFKKRYANEAVRVGQQEGFNKVEVQNIVQSIYAFEDGGWGTYETLSGMPQTLVAADAPGETKIADMRGKYHPLSTGLGYNQLLRSTTMLTLDQHAGDIAASLKLDATQDPSRRDMLLAKADLVEHLKTAMDKELTRMGRRMGGNYLKNGEATDLLYSTFASSDAPTSFGVPAGKLAEAIHSLNLDGDIGPILQAQELSGLLNFAHTHNFEQLLASDVTTVNANAAAYDVLPADRKAKAVDELIKLIHPEKISANSTIPISDQDVASFRSLLLNLKPGSDPVVTRASLTSAQFALLNLGALTLRKVGEATGPLSPDAKLLVDKLVFDERGGITAQSLIPAAVELVNLAGEGSASMMLQPANRDYPTANFFTRAGYYANGVTNERSANELLMQVDRIMNGLNRDPKKTGQAQFGQIFQP